MGFVCLVSTMKTYGINMKEEIPLGEDTRPKDRIKQGISSSTIIENWECTSEGELCDDQDCPIHRYKPQNDFVGNPSPLY